MKSIGLALMLAALGVAPAMAAAPHEPVRPTQVTRTIPDTVRFDQEIAKGNQVHMTVTNYGFFGNNFFSKDPSLEYPANRGYEHMVRGGLWVGAHARDENGEFDGVTTGTVDAAQGPTSPEASEWTPADRQILARSTLLTSEFYDLDAVSELDMLTDYNDYSPTRAASVGENHRSMSLEVHQESYQWNFAEFQNILFLHIKITNRGPLMTNVWTGIYSELASGNKGGYVNWPPSSTDPGGLGSWFNNKWLVYDEQYKLEREHYCDAMPSPPDPSSCKLERAPYWIGFRYLGAKGLMEDTTRTRQRSVSAWSWSPGNVYRDEDRERYALMNSGVIQPFTGDSLLPGSGDPVEVYSVGPFPKLYRDSSITVDFAVVGGATVPDIQHNSGFAQFAYDHDYILPVPPPAPRFTVVARDTALDYYWNDISESAYDVTSPDPHDFEGYRVYIGEDPDTLARVAQFDAAGDTASFNTGFGDIKLAQPVTIGGVTYQYHYSVTHLRNGFKYYAAVTAFDIGNTQIVPLESGFSQNRILAVPAPAPGEVSGLKPTVFPNPYRVEARWDRGTNVRDHFLWFTGLPARCLIRIYTLAGDLVFEQDFDGSTYHGEGARGIYDPSKSLGKPTLSGSTFGWNLITREGQAAATGLYMFSVEDRATGKRFVGKFLIVKSDREG